MKNNQSIWLFDSICVLCDGAVNYTLQHERAPTIRFISIQSNVGRELALENNIDPDDPTTFLFLENGIAHAKSDGVIALARHLNGPARLALLARLVPKRFRDFAYDLIAGNRYRLFGKKDACMIPTPEHSWRFVL